MVFIDNELDLDSIVENLLSNELNMVLVQATPNSWLKLIEEKSKYNEKMGIYGCGKFISYHLFPIYYKQDKQPEISLAAARAVAVHNIFDRWNECGYNRRHAKEPYGSKTFKKYLDDIGYFEADYLLLAVAD